MAINLGQLARTTGQAVVGYRRGQSEGDALKRALERQQMEFALRLAPFQRQASEAGAANQFLSEQPEGSDLSGRGLNPTAALGIYSSRLAAQRARTPTPVQTHNLQRQANLDLKARAQAEADYIARTNEQPSALGIFAALRAKRTYKGLDDETLRGVAAEAVGPKRGGNTDLQEIIRRAAEGLGVQPAATPP